MSSPSASINSQIVRATACVAVIGLLGSSLSLKFSDDDGKTWTKNRVLEPGLAGYSDLAIGEDGDILCFYEAGSIDGSHYRTKALRLARMPLEWLTESK